MPALRYTFKTNQKPQRSITVFANEINEAFMKARAELDKRCRKRGVAYPSGWDVECTGRHLNWKKR